MLRDIDYAVEDVIQPIPQSASPLGTQPADESYQSALVQFEFLYDEARSAEVNRSQTDGVGISRGDPEDRAEWVKLARIGLQVLAEEWKDFGLLAKITQAIVRTDGLLGLHFAYDVATQLTQRYWDDFLSQSHGDPVIHLVAFSNLDKALRLPIRRIAITQSGLPYWFCQKAFEVRADLHRHAGETEDERAKRMAEHRVTEHDVEDYQRELGETEAPFLCELVDHLERAKELVTNYRDTVAEQIQRRVQQLNTEAAALRDNGEAERADELERAADREQDAELPSIGGTVEVIEDILRFVHEVAGDKLSEPAVEESAPDELPTSAPQQAHANGQPIGLNPANRAEAFDRLEAIAKFFESSEPQSLIPSQIRQVIRQGRMSPREFFAELIEDEVARERMIRLLGLPHAGEDHVESTS